MRDRAFRRHQKDRKKAKAERIARNCWALDSSDVDDVVEIARRHADNLKMCSCDICCTPRRSRLVKEKRTVQERRAGDWK